MADQKAEILSEFDTLISELKALVRDIPDYSGDRDHRGPSSYVSPENEERYIALRTRCVALLNRINSKDVKLKEAIDFIRDTDILLWNIQKSLEKMQSLRAEYAEGILTSHPRLIDPYIPAPEKPSWFERHGLQILLAIIAALGLIGAAVAPRLLDEFLKGNDSNSIIVTVTPIATDTPMATATIFVIPSPTP